MLSHNLDNCKEAGEGGNQAWVTFIHFSFKSTSFFLLHIEGGEAIASVGSKTKERLRVEGYRREPRWAAFAP